MSEFIQYKTKNQIFKDFITLSNTALLEFNVKDWTVKRLYQNIKTVDLKPFVFVQIMNKKQASTQGKILKKVSETTYNTDYTGFYDTELQPFNQAPLYNGEDVEIINNTYLKQYVTKQEVTLRFSATMRNKNNETVETLDCIDVLEYIKNWLQSDDGILALSQMGYAQYRATDINQQSFNNDDENIQFLPYFDCVYTYTDIWQTDVNKISKVELKGIYKVN